MPAFFARWSDGSFSVVCADDEREAALLADEFGDDPVYVWRAETCAMDFELTDDGTFRLKDFGEDTVREIMERGYPTLKKTIEGDEAFEAHEWEGPAVLDKYGSKAVETLRRAVKAERARRSAPETDDDSSDPSTRYVALPSAIQLLTSK